MREYNSGIRATPGRRDFVLGLSVAMIPPPPTSVSLAPLAFAAGALAGRGLAALTGRLARAEGYPSSHYHALADGARLADVPIVGHFVRARGSRCHRLLLLEWGGALAGVLCWTLFPPAKAACGAVFLLALLGASCLDFDHLILPDPLTVGLAALGLVLSALVPALHGQAAFGPGSCLRSAAAAGLGVAIGSALVLWFSLLGEMILRREVLGFGDVKFLGAIGAFCGWQGAVFAVFGGAAIAAGVLGVAALAEFAAGGGAVRGWRAAGPAGENRGAAGGAHFPFGPMLAAAAALYFLALHPLVDRYLAHYLVLF
jgi:leader peptidase (prepilin peptidase)/N-methyltransferase